MVTIELCNKDTQLSQTCSEGYTFSATALYRGVSLFLGSIKLTRRNKAPCFLLVSTQANNHAPQATRHTTAPQLCMIDNKIEFFFMYRLQIGPDRFDTEHVWLEEQSCYP